MGKKSKQFRILGFILADILLINLAALLAVVSRFDFSFANAADTRFFHNMLRYALINTAVTLLLFYLFRLYHSSWEHAGSTEVLHIAGACVVSSLLYWVGSDLLGMHMFRSFPLLYVMFLTAFIGGIRLGTHIFGQIRSRLGVKKKRRTMVIGAGAAGDMVVREFLYSGQVENRVVCIVDDDSAKTGNYLRGVKIAGTTQDIPELAEKYQAEEIVLAIPSASKAERARILEICRMTDCKLSTLPGLYQLANGEVSIQRIRQVDIEDLLGRDTVKINLAEVAKYIEGKTVLVTGGGGSIGSELCRMAASQNPRRLIVFDIYENNAYDLQMELRKKYPYLDLVVLIGSVRDAARMNSVFEQYRPELVFHAAAHKHVPLMEVSPFEAIKNNVFGTYNTAKAADRFGAERFVLISTDKAVNPTNVMGASKRMCEMIVQMMNERSKTDYVAVRFGNVLGSAGSVIPLFRRQIAEGGPVTVTDKRIIRYFMTIPEAVQLIFQAGAYAKGGEIFVLDMGDPVKIDDLARNMIRLSGLEPDVDIPIVYTGLRPGEKLYEELLMSGEGMEKTPNDLIFIGHEMPFDHQLFEEQLDQFRHLKESHGTNDILRQIVKEVVPTYHDPKDNITAKEAAMSKEAAMVREPVTV